MKRTPLRKVSKKRAKLMRQVKPERDAYRAEFRMCQLCHRKLAQHVHEIASGPARQRALEVRAAWLSLCEGCHRRMHDYSDFPVSRQCAVKFLADAECFDLDVINRLRGRASTAITWADVAVHLELRT